MFQLGAPRYFSRYPELGFSACALAVFVSSLFGVWKL